MRELARRVRLGLLLALMILPGFARGATATFDFNGDGKSDILWRHSSGQVYAWDMNGLAIGSSGSLGTVADANWQIVGVGDFNGDGKADILWRHAVTGQTFVWLMNGLSIAASGSPGTVADLNWQVQGVGDFNGDGMADVFWRHVVTGQTFVWLMNGLSIASAGSPSTVADLNWHVEGTADYNGDGKADILWRRSDGQDYLWFMNGLTIGSSGSLPSVPDANWNIQGTGDYNGDGMADILWRHAVTGQTYVWLMNGPSIVSSGSPGTVADPNWQVQNPPARAAALLALVGNWSGGWIDTTFATSGTATMSVSVNTTAQTYQVTIDLNGPVFGLGDPPPQTFSGAYTGTGANVTVVSPLFGTLTLSVSPNGQISGSAINVPGGFVSRIDFTGTWTPSTINIADTISFIGGGAAVGTLTFNKQ